MKWSKYALYNSSGGALLFAIITAFVLSLTGATLVAMTCNQYKIINTEINRKKAYYWLYAGMEYANYMIRTGEIQGSTTITLPENSQVQIAVTKPSPDGRSKYRIEVSTEY